MQTIEIPIIRSIKRARMSRLDFKIVRQACIARTVRLPRVLCLGAVEGERAVGCGSAARLCPDKDLGG